SACWPNGKALDYESRDCRFDPCVGQLWRIERFLFAVFSSLRFLKMIEISIFFFFLLLLDFLGGVRSVIFTEASPVFTTGTMSKQPL
ncbi:hypothetical protein BDZ45DRAFT_775040, partial [Acephala macrosclerotiorum]